MSNKKTIMPKKSFYSLSGFEVVTIISETMLESKPILEIIDKLDESLKGFYFGKVLIKDLEEHKLDDVLLKLKFDLKKSTNNDKANCLILFEELKKRFEKDAQTGGVDAKK